MSCSGSPSLSEHTANTPEIRLFTRRPAVVHGTAAPVGRSAQLTEKTEIIVPAHAHGTHIGLDDLYIDFTVFGITTARLAPG